MAIKTSTIKIKKIENFDNDYIENTLKTNNYNFVRWAITAIDNSGITLTVSYIE